jgi:hypothetical protein
MTEYSNAGGALGRSIHDALERSRREIADERVERIMAAISKSELEAALVILLLGIRDAEAELSALEYRLRHVANGTILNSIDNASSALIEDGIDRVVDLLGDEVVAILEGGE